MRDDPWFGQPCHGRRGLLSACIQRDRTPPAGRLARSRFRGRTVRQRAKTRWTNAAGHCTPASSADEGGARHGGFRRVFGVLDAAQAAGAWDTDHALGPFRTEWARFGRNLMPLEASERPPGPLTLRASLAATPKLGRSRWLPSAHPSSSRAPIASSDRLWPARPAAQLTPCSCTALTGGAPRGGRPCAGHRLHVACARARAWTPRRRRRTSPAG